MNNKEPALENLVKKLILHGRLKSSKAASNTRT